jgi:hypothetical protein
MPIVKRRLDICGREKAWEYLVESAGGQFRVEARQVGRGEPAFRCSCGTCLDPETVIESLWSGDRAGPCAHIAEAQRDLSIARQAAAQMVP